VEGTDQYTDQEVVLVGDRREPDGDWTVQMRVLGRRDGVSREVAKVDFRLRQREDRWRAIDVTVEGVSLAVSFRAQFQSLMSAGGIERVLGVLREKNAAAARAEASAATGK
jgi:phospholipid transport system substrate-binding protein